MNEPDTLIIVHYHFLTGGVCSSIQNSLTALAQSGWLSQRSVRVLTGRKDGIEELRRSLERWSIPLTVEVDPRLDYSDRLWSDESDFWEEASAFAGWFLEQGQGACLYWIHNPTLGKNPLFTASLTVAARRAATAGTPHRFLYHIHDFAECGRIGNLMRLRRCWSDGGIGDFYPLTNNVGYGVLNTADSKRLGRAGVPQERIHLLPNAVLPVGSKGMNTREAMGTALQTYASNHGYRFESDRPWWTMPIRLIRRKNVLEALMVAATASHSPQMLITLDANSEPERPYADAVKALIRRDNHAAVIGFGRELVGTVFGFDDLLLSSDAVVTTSVLEGFGFAFLDGANRGRPLVGRNLPDVTADFVVAGFPSSSLYSQVLVPIDNGRREQMIGRGRRFAHNHGPLLGVKSGTMEAFIDHVERIFSRDTIDFGLLDLANQLHLARKIRDTAFVKDLKALNPNVAEPACFPPDFSERTNEHFGFKPHASRLATAFESLFRAGYEEPQQVNVSSRLLDAYFVPQFYRPLLGAW